MPKLDICTALVQLNEYTVISRSETKPLNYAEVELLRFTLGERAIMDLKVIETVETTNQDVLDRLRERYGKDTVAEAFPGTRPRLPMEAPDDVPRVGAEPLEAPKHAASKKKAVKDAAFEKDLPPLEDADADPFETTGD